MLANTHPATRWPTPPVTRSVAPGSVGLVQRQYAHFDSPLHLRSGGTLERFSLAYETYGTLNADRSNAILVCHALSGDAHVAGYHTAIPTKSRMVGDAGRPRKIFDTDRFFVICSNVIGGCQGSTGLPSPAPDGKPYALRFPMVTVDDMVEAQRRLLDRLGIRKVFAVTGGSMGAMQALQWAVAHPDRVEHVLFLASTPRSSALHIAFNETGRQAIYADPNWNNGDYYGGPAPTRGLAVARMAAHITYMSEASLEHKFGRNLQDHETLPLYAGRAGIRRRELPGLPGAQVRRALRREQLPVHHQGHRLLRHRGGLRLAPRRAGTDAVRLPGGELHQRLALHRPTGAGPGRAAPRVGPPGRASPHRGAVRPRLIPGRGGPHDAGRGRLPEPRLDVALRVSTPAPQALRACTLLSPLSTTSL